jgi:hypothetical protein
MFLTQLKTLIHGDKTKYTLQELLDHFESNNIAVFLVLATFITSIPLPPWGGGFETMPGGFLCLLLALEGLLGLKTVYIPAIFRDISIDISFIQNSKITTQSIEWIETHIVPNRHSWALNGLNEKIMYLLVIPNALLMILPIIFTNGPPSQTITLMALAWLVADGLFFLIMLFVSFFVVVMYIVLFFVFAKFLYRTRRHWTFGLWR